MDNWQFAQLNELSPLFGNSPANGPSLDRSSLSYPIDSAGLASQLEQWTNLPFEDTLAAYPAYSDFSLLTTPYSTYSTTTDPLIEPLTEAYPSATKKRGPDSDEQANATAIEEDKRKRNTAASARFRIKKKQREHALEETAKELQTKVASLEAQVSALVTENNHLRDLLILKKSNE